MSGTPVEVTAEKENELPSAQRSSTWFSERVGKITPSKAPAVIGLQERKEFQETRDFIKNKKSEPQKCIRNFDRGIAFEAEAAEVFASESGAVLKECGLFCMKTDGNYGGSPDRTFQGETCKKLFEIKTGKEVKLSGLCLLEIKTQAEGI